MTIGAIIFDLDGTLADTLDGIVESMNRTLERFGMPGHARDAYRRFVGDGVRKLVERAVPADRRDRVDAVLGAYLPELRERGGAAATLYGGVAETIEALAERGMPMAVLSNKPHDATVDVVDRLLGLDRFVEVRGQRGGEKVKPDPTVALGIADRLGVEPGRIGYVGDSDVDMNLAHNAGFIAIGAGWGIRGADELRTHDAACVIGEPTELLELVERGV